MRDRVAVVFMTLSLVATLILGGALVHDLGKTQQVVATGTTASGGGGSGGVSAGPSAGGGAAGGSGSASGSASAGTPGGGGTAGTPGSPGSAGTPGSAGQAGTSGPAAPTGQLATSNVGVSGGVVTVGGIYDETGPFDATVERDTIRSYFDNVNATGGVNGYKFQLLECDSGYDPTQAHQCAQRLLSQNVLAIVGWLSVSGEQPEAAYLNSQGVPMIGGLGVPSEFGLPLSFPATADVTRTGTAVGNHAKDVGIKAPGIVVLNVNFIKGVETTLLAALHANGIHEKGSIDEVDATKPDYTDEAIKLRSEGVDSIIAVLDPFSYARLFQALDRQQFHPTLLATGLDKKSAEAQYGSAAYGAFSLTPLLEPDGHASQPTMAAYYGAVRRYFPSQVDALDVYSESEWVAAEVFSEAVKRLGSTPLTRKSLVDSLQSIKNFDSGLSVPLTYSPGNSHDPNRCFQYIHDQQGTWQTDSDWKCV